MDKQPEALRLADAIENRTHTYGDVDAAADELRRLHEAHDWQYKMAGERLRRIEKLERINAQLLEALETFVLANSSEEFVTLVVRSNDITNARAAIERAHGIGGDK